jgi:hypothetical protein
MSVKIIKVAKQLPKYSRTTSEILPFLDTWLFGQEERFIRKVKKRDLSKSCQVGFDKSKYDTILVMDGDLQHDPIYIKKLHKTLIKTKSDLVIGVRDFKKEKLKILDHNLFRLFFSRLLILIFKMLCYLL